MIEIFILCLNIWVKKINRFSFISIIFLEADLHNVIRKGNILKDTHKRYVMYQLLKAMKYLHSANVIHRDMKVKISIERKISREIKFFFSRQMF
jgi:mitogen-activated protein kinase 15